MKPSLIPLLACPACAGPLALAPGATTISSEDIEEGRLGCGSCAEAYPIVRGIPRFAHQALASDVRATADAFGWQWNHFDEITPDHERQFLAWAAPVTAADFAGRIVLDAGCGKGRHLACAVKFGAAQAVGVDLSDAVEAAWRNVRHLPQAHVVQADIHRLPFRGEAFDVAYSVGVLHHLPDPKRGFDAIVPLVRRGGRLIAWVYGREGNGWIVRFVTPLREQLTSRMPRRALRLLSAVVAGALLLPPLRLLYGPLHRAAPRLSARILPYEAYLSQVSTFSLRELTTIVFDHLVAPTSHYLTRKEFAAWFDRPDLEPPIIGWHNRMSWRGTALRR